ncbi:patched domain-containing protein 3-like [Myripristis murdjan]|uniref:patched domain-containing protein 3-like n=1 Tax=Myripristis murdjan TaxID=586833 RepID=UPI0011761CFC|nr:patched domain-containing protein 3-like [Myripristis murdjan]
MGKCHMDCIERPLSLGLEKLGHFVGCHPWWFFITPLVLSAGLGSGFYFITDRMSNDIEEQFTPVNGKAKMERRYIQENFPENNSMFSNLRLSTDGTFATFIATSDSNVLTVESLQEILDLDRKVRTMVVSFDNKPFEYVNLCARVEGNCYSNDILDIIDYTASNIDLVSLTFPWYYYKSQRVALYASLGSVKLNKENSVVESAQAIQLRYYLQEDNKTKTDRWLEDFLNLLSNVSTTSTKVSYSTSMSMQWEIEKFPDAVTPLFAITYTIAITFSIMSCWRLDNVTNKVWVAYGGVFVTALTILSSFGMLLLIGQPFVITVASCPFMILGIGIDDMFIMVSCWQRTNFFDRVPKRLADTYKDAAVSITITTLTDALALFLGYTSTFHSVQAFCLYGGLSVVFCYLYNITFLGALMALNGQREEKNRHWFTCSVIPYDLPSDKSKCFTFWCDGGSYDPKTNMEKMHPMNHFFKKFYGPFLTQKWIKLCVLVIYAGYLAVSIYGCYTLEEGLDISNLALDGSYIIDYYDDQSLHFSEYSLSVMVAVKQPLHYWSEDDQKNLSSCIDNFENLNYVNNTFAWFLSFQQYANAASLNINSQQAFQRHLPEFLDRSPMFRQDINFTSDNEIQASRFFIQIVNETSTKDTLIGLRKTAEQCEVKLLVYHPAFIYFDQYTVILQDTIVTILVAAVVMLVISLMLIPSVLCSLWVAFAICSVIVGVMGFMALWGVNLDSISMINLVMCIGFSVDFSAHISYSFVSSSKDDVNEKAQDAVAHLGYPVLQGAVSTILGVVVLSISAGYVFRTFFKIMFLVIGFGLFHGLMFIPVFLTLFGICRKC